MAEDAWNSRDPKRVSLAYIPDCSWRNRTEFLAGHAAIQALLTRKWASELDYRLTREVWGFRENRMAVRFAYESRDAEDQSTRSYGDELWEFDERGLMSRRVTSTTTCRSARTSAFFIGRRGADPTTTPASATSASDPTPSRELQLKTIEKRSSISADPRGRSNPSAPGHWKQPVSTIRAGHQRGRRAAQAGDPK